LQSPGIASIIDTLHFRHDTHYDARLIAMLTCFSPAFFVFSLFRHYIAASADIAFAFAALRGERCCAFFLFSFDISEGQLKADGCRCAPFSFHYWP
jgi:hypothetical protein